jgi:hypothetical protein
MKKPVIVIMFIFCFVLFFGLRFYNLERRIGFDWDPERDAFQVEKIIVQKKPVLIGPRVVSEKGFFLAPYHTYSLVPFYFFGRMNPLNSIMIYVVFSNIIFFFFTFYVIKKIQGLTHTVSFLLFCSVNFLLIGHQIGAGNPAPIVLEIIIYWLLLFSFYHAKPPNKFFITAILGFSFGVFCNFHFQFIFEFIAFLVFIFCQKIRIIDQIKFFLIFIFFATLSLMPLFIFDLRNSFLNFHLFFSFFAKSGSSFHLFNFETLSPIFQSFLPIIWRDSAFSSLTSAGLFVFFLYINVSLANRNRGFLRLFFISNSLILILTPIVFSIYSGNIAEYYFLYLLPIIFTSFSFWIVKYRYHQIIILAILFVSICYVLFHYFPYKNNENMNLYQKDKLISSLKKRVGEKEIFLALDTPLGLNTGFRYLAKYYKIRATEKPNVPLYIIHLPPRKNDLTFGAFGLKQP